MKSTFGMYALFASILSLAGCKKAVVPPTTAGVSVDLTYPVLLIGQSDLNVCDSKQALVSWRGSSSMNLNERSVLDSQGRLFLVTSAQPISGQPNPMLSMGTQDRLYFVTVAEQPRPSWPEIQEMILKQVNSPTSTWNGNPAAIAHVRAMKGVAELIQSCRETWTWSQ